MFRDIEMPQAFLCRPIGNFELKCALAETMTPSILLHSHPYKLFKQKNKVSLFIKWWWWWWKPLAGIEKLPSTFKHCLKKKKKHNFCLKFELFFFKGEKIISSGYLYNSFPTLWVAVSYLLLSSSFLHPLSRSRSRSNSRSVDSLSYIAVVRDGCVSINKAWVWIMLPTASSSYLPTA